MRQPIKVLIVDDEASQRSGLATLVSAWGMLPETAGDGNEALLKLADFPADVILTDLNMPGLDGFGLLRRLRDSGDMPPAIVLTEFGNIETAVKTVHELGAYWFLEKPIQPGVLETLVRRAGSHAGLRAEKRNLERQLGYKGSLGELVGASAKMQEIFAPLQQAGPSELFGHEKGSFTGAFERRAGCFEAAQGGTLLLDEIGEMPMQTQAKLLRILEDSRVRRLGGKAEFEVDVPPESPAEDDPDCIKFRVGATVEEAEKGLILVTLEHTRNNKTRAAEILGISLKTLHNKLNEYGAG